MWIYLSRRLCILRRRLGVSLERVVELTRRYLLIRIELAMAMVRKARGLMVVLRRQILSLMRDARGSYIRREVDMRVIRVWDHCLM